MTRIDLSFLYHVRKWIDGGNPHRLKTWIFCYETSPPGSENRRRYERLPRKVVGTEHQSQIACSHSNGRLQKP
jgi:hypothetical protein